jgi:small-conductance mechanosensitive channel
MSFEESLAAYPWLVWSLGLIAGFPMAALLLSETLHRLEIRGHALAGSVRHLRNVTLPLLAILIFLKKMLDMPETETVCKLADTLLSVSVLFVLLSFGNVLLFAQASVDSWRARVPKLFLDLSGAFFIFLGLGLVSGLVWGADLKAFFTALGIGSVVIGLALQDTLGNLFSGIALLFEKPFAIGDVIRFGDQEGTVKEMSWRATWIHVTRTNTMLVIPNLALAKDRVLNLTRLGPHLARVGFNFSPDDPPNRVKQMLRLTAVDVPGVLESPAPFAITTGYNESAVSYEAVFAVNNYPAAASVSNEFRSRVWYVARRHGLRLAFPALDGRPGHSKLPPETEDLAEILAGFGLLQGLPEPVLRALAQDSALQRFACQEFVLREGDVSATLYLIVEGEALLSTRDKRGIEREAARLERGEYISILQVLLGETSSVSVRALTDLTLLSIPATVANRLLEQSPQLARDLGQALEIRRQAILQAKEGRAARV